LTVLGADQREAMGDCEQRVSESRLSLVSVASAERPGAVKGARLRGEANP